MNALEQWIEDHPEIFWTETTAMNELQENGIVADEAVSLQDVAETDCPMAVAFLEAQG